jgi:hypothetical protein
VKRRDIPGLPGCQADSEGNIYRGFGSIKVAQWIGTTNPYARCVILGKEYYVHQLVCLAFHGPKPSPEHEVAHQDDVKSVNTPDSLRWDTHKGNIADRVRLRGR